MYFQINFCRDYNFFENVKLFGGTIFENQLPLH